MIKIVNRYHILSNELESDRASKSKRFLTKFMFKCAVGKPHIAFNGETIFDGKFRIFLFETVEPTKMNSKNRLKGILETKLM